MHSSLLNNTICLGIEIIALKDLHFPMLQKNELTVQSYACRGIMEGCRVFGAHLVTSILRVHYCCRILRLSSLLPLQIVSLLLQSLQEYEEATQSIRKQPSKGCHPYLGRGDTTLAQLSSATVLSSTRKQLPLSQRHSCGRQVSQGGVISLACLSLAAYPIQAREARDAAKHS